ncbi:MAG: bifunctional diaminohydroxyphosphoribosylaminopyrimidine deaminase/5-amino-6-(5-phosphoribosylamino)uracil reductase RibD [Sphingobacteriales bacterium]|nr:bifunctional diaminohydroxyphosphoribosylaminopyrimidine deaminase/5-amino-6-(5-phosphoribosylamino)uracil reductase RibD [Sphingobacteriales bacterium]
MYRCLELARKGAGYTAPNPMVGAVLVQDDRIIGEGWHQRYGEAHAEVNAINSAQLSLSDRATGLTAFVSLEPCAHHGKTPPCADLLIRTGIPKVVIGCRDPFEAVNGKGVEKLRAAGVEVLEGVLEQECRELNKRFFTFHEMKRPYVILKWAQTADGFLANSPFTEGGMTENTAMKRLRISNEYTDRLVHRWRSEEAAILVGTNTALQDDPALTNRLWPGLSPVRLVVDMDLRLPSSLQLFNGEQKTFVFNAVKEETKQNLVYYRLEKNKSLISQLLPALHQLNIQSVLVEGGSRLLQSFIDTGLWDEARVITNTAMKTGTGLAAPFLENGAMKETTKLAQDEIQTWQNAGRIKK